MFQGDRILSCSEDHCVHTLKYNDLNNLEKQITRFQLPTRHAVFSANESFVAAAGEYEIALIESNWTKWWNHQDCSAHEHKPGRDSQRTHWSCQKFSLWSSRCLFGMSFHLSWSYPARPLLDVMEPSVFGRQRKQQRKLLVFRCCQNATSVITNWIALLGILLEVGWLFLREMVTSSLIILNALDIKVLDRDTWKVSYILKDGHSKPVSLIAWSPNGNYLASSGTFSTRNSTHPSTIQLEFNLKGLDNQVLIWDTTSKVSLHKHKHDVFMSGMSWSPKANALALIDVSGRFGIWENPVPSKFPNPWTLSHGKIQKTENNLASLFENDEMEDDLDDVEGQPKYALSFFKLKSSWKLKIPGKFLKKIPMSILSMQSTV